MSDMPNSSWHIIKQLNLVDSFELFIFHAFKGTKPPSKASNLKMYDLATRITCSCDGLPLALEILGKHMFWERKDVGSKIAQTLLTRPEVLSKLSINFEGLQWRSLFLEYVPCKMCFSYLAVLDLSNSCSLTQLWSKD